MKLTAETRREKYKEGPDHITLPEKLDNIGLKLNNDIYFDPKQKNSTMGQMRVTE